MLPLPNEAPLLLGWIVTYVASVSELLAILVCSSFVFCMVTNCSSFLSPFQLTTAVVGVKTRVDVATGVHIFC